MALELLIKAPVHATRQFPEKRVQAATEQVLWFDVVEGCGCIPKAVDLAGLTLELSAWRDQLDPDSEALFLAKAGAIVAPAEDGRVAFTITETDLPDVETVHMRLDVKDGGGTRVASVSFEFQVQGVD